MHHFAGQRAPFARSMCTIPAGVFKFKACVGRDDNGKQIFKCTTWYPPAELTPAKARKEAQKVAAIWEDEVRQAYLKEREEKAVAGVSPAYTFDTFLPAWR